MEFLFLLVLLSLPQSKPVRKPPAEVACVMHNYSYIVSHYDNTNNKLDEVEMDDFWVGGHDPEDRGGCYISIGDKLIYGSRDKEGRVVGVPLVTAHPTSSHDAIIAIDEFRNKTAVALVKEYREGKK